MADFALPNYVLEDRVEKGRVVSQSISTRRAWVLVLSTSILVMVIPSIRQWTSGHGELVTILSEACAAALRHQSPAAANRELLVGFDNFETKLKTTSPMTVASRSPISGLKARWLGVNNRSVLPKPVDGTHAGRWLVLRADLKHVIGPPFLDADRLEGLRRSIPSWKPAFEPDPRPAILSLHQQLQDRGIELIFMPVPTKVSAAPEALGLKPGNRDLRNPSLQPLLAQLEDAGVHIFDPLPLLRQMATTKGNAFLKTDSHWSPQAVENVAAALAEKIEDITQLPPRNRQWARSLQPKTGHGDLWHALHLKRESSLYPQEIAEIRQVHTESGKPWSAKVGSSVLVLGDSHTNVYSDNTLHWGTSAGLAEHLAYSLGRDVDRLAIAGNSTDKVREELAEQPERLHATRVVVYEVASHMLSTGHWPVVSFPDS